MKLGNHTYFCSCLLKNFVEHETLPDDNDCCVYCGYHVLERKITEKDLRAAEKNKDKLDALKKQQLDVLVKEKIHKGKIQ